jgi:hypothetical protein
MFRRSRAKLLRRLILHVGKHRDAGRQPGENRKSVLVPCWSPVWRPANAWDLDGKQCPPDHWGRRSDGDAPGEARVRNKELWRSGE